MIQHTRKQGEEKGVTSEKITIHQDTQTDNPHTELHIVTYSRNVNSINIIWFQITFSKFK